MSTQKQYIFLYRALLDIAQFGNTELPAKELSAAVDNLKARLTDSKEQCKLEIEFEVCIPPPKKVLTVFLK